MPDRVDEVADRRGRAARLLGSRAAAHQAALLFLVSGTLALLSAPLPWTPPGPLLVIATVDVIVAVLIWLAPWSRWPPKATLATVPIALGVVAYAEWHLDTGSGVVAFLAMLFVWIGLHHGAAVAVAVSPLAMLASVGPLLAHQGDAAMVTSTVGAVLVVLLVGGLTARLVDDLRATNDRLQATDVWRARLMAAFAHDVRTPLSVIASTLHLLERHRGELDEQRLSQVLAATRRHVERINRLAYDLLDEDRIEHGKLRLDLEPVLVTAAITDALTTANVSASETRCDDRLVVLADPARFEQILVNLLTNAQRYGAPPIQVSASRQGDEAQIVIRDHGRGLPHVPAGPFAAYNSGDAPTSVGLGLWLAQALTEAHGGRLSYHDANPGAAFTVALPTARNPHSETVTRRAQPGHGSIP